MDPIDNNQFEVKPNPKSKRKIVSTPCPNAYLNPALNLLANEDPMCNNAMEIVPNKKPKIVKTCELAAFENSALDLGISKAAINEFLVRELENVQKTIRAFDCPIQNNNHLTHSVTTNHRDRVQSIQEERSVITEPIYANDIPLHQDNIFIENTNMEYRQEYATTESQDSTDKITNNMTVIPFEESEIENSMSPPANMEISKINDTTDVESGVLVLEQNAVDTVTINELENNDISAINNTTNIQTNVTNQLFVNNTSNLSLSFIDRLALDSPNNANQSLYFDDDLNESNIMEIKTITIITKKKLISNKKKNTNPFLEPNKCEKMNMAVENPFLDNDKRELELEYNDVVVNRTEQIQIPQANVLMPRRLFTSDTNSTISTVNESLNTVTQNEYENIDGYRSESPIYENMGDEGFNDANFNKQSKILGQDVSQFSAIDIMNLNKNSQGNSSNESNSSKKDLKHQILKASNKLSKKVFKTLKKTFKSDKSDHNSTLNPYEVPRKVPKQKPVAKEAGIENPALNLDNSDEIDIEEIDDVEHQYETIKTLRNTRLNMNVTPLREKGNENIDISQNKTNTPGKKVRFDSTLNQEKIITGNSFDCELQSPGFDAKIDKYHDELENCINERKFLQQNM